MKKIFLLAFALFIGLNVFGQRRRDIGNMPQANHEPTAKEIEKREREMEERKEEYIDNFLTTLDADDFQKVIIKQKLDSYFDAKMALLKTNFEHSFDKKQAIKQLDETHFLELKDLISEKDYAKVEELIKGEFDEKEVKKKKKKNRRKKG
ncbi:hypothetical protein [Winogradskyella ursingii]|uniref:hypothetical protein n=1 Tax=Winogradskyella ursingii TaxID=2686079 RepID=UPI0015CD7B65|nr:hypothetical protein [Winogradskyella ursingii]